MAVITDGKLWNDSLSGYLAEVVSATDYEPFGLALDGRSLSNEAYRYGFNGKEDDGDFSFGIQDYGFRLYSRKLAKFLSVDPLAASYPWYTPYQFAGNKPIWAVDLDGLEDIPWFRIIWGMITGTPSPHATDEEIRQYHTSPHHASERQLRSNLIATHDRIKPLVDGAPQVAKEAADVVLPVELYYNIAEGKNLDGSDASALDVSLNILAIVPAGKLAKLLKPIKGAAKPAGRLLIEYGGKAYDITSKAVERLRKIKICGCFTAGTMVLTADGYKPIEEIEIGDLVWAYDEKTGHNGLKAVSDTIRLNWDELYVIQIDSTNTIEATYEHPFYVSGNWVEAKDLSVGDSLYLFSGGAAAVTEIATKQVNSPVYNLTVDGFSTYFVSSKGVLVHNCGFGTTIGADLLSKLSPIRAKDLTGQKAGTGRFAEIAIAIRDNTIWAQNSDGKWSKLSSHPDDQYSFIIDNNGVLKIGYGHYFLSGEASHVLAAGSLELKAGKITFLSNGSGHYQPSTEDLNAVAEVFKAMGISAPEWNVKKFNWKRK